MNNRGDNMQVVKVIRRANDANIKPIVNYDTNTILNTCVYDVIFPDGLII